MGAHGGAHRRSTASNLAPQALLSAVIEMSDDAIFTCDTRGRLTTWSATAERLFGSPAGDVLDGPFEALFPEHFRHDVRAVMETLLAGDRIRHFETEVLRPDGMPMPVSLSMCPLFEADERIGSVVIARDVTEQRLTQATLAELEARLEEGEALTHVGSWLWDVRTGAVQWSAEFHRIHGVEPFDFDGTFESYLGRIHPADRDWVRTAMDQSLTSGRPFEGEYRVIRPDQEVRLVRVRAQPTMGSAGTAVGLRGSGEDVTERAGAGVSPGRRGF
jgi:PAS domain S-box-containing protein